MPRILPPVFLPNNRALIHRLLRASATLREIIRSWRLSGVPIRPGKRNVPEYNQRDRLTADTADFTE
jgi:hypothetical protein